MDFDQWMEAVDQAVWEMAFCSVHDLSDQTFRDWFEAGITPLVAAEMTLVDNDFDLEWLDDDRAE